MAMAEIPPNALIISIMASSKREMQSHRMFPRGVRRNRARWPMANCGSIPIPIRPGSLNLIDVRFVRRNRSSVVHCWPVLRTYCLSSWQIVQELGGWSLSAYCVPQVEQMKFGIFHYLEKEIYYTEHSLHSHSAFHTDHFASTSANQAECTHVEMLTRCQFDHHQLGKNCRAFGGPLR